MFSTPLLLVCLHLVYCRCIIKLTRGGGGVSVPLWGANLGPADYAAVPRFESNTRKSKPLSKKAEEGTPTPVALCRSFLFLPTEYSSSSVSFFSFFCDFWAHQHDYPTMHCHSGCLAWIKSQLSGCIGSFFLVTVRKLRSLSKMRRTGHFQSPILLAPSTH